jgi:hypothetical protein
MHGARAAERHAASELGAVMPSTSRNTQSSGVSPSTSTLCAFPLTLIAKGMAISPLRAVVIGVVSFQHARQLAAIWSAPIVAGIMVFEAQAGRSLSPALSPRAEREGALLEPRVIGHFLPYPRR